MRFETVIGTRSQRAPSHGNEQTTALSTAEGLLLQPRGEGELIELSDDEAVAAAVMLPIVAADRLAPSASSHTGGAFKRNVRGVV